MKTIEFYALYNIIRQLVYVYQRKFETVGVNSYNEQFNEGSFHFIPSERIYLKRFHEYLSENKIRKNAKIIDAGCGVSPILLFAQVMGYNNLHGIDIFTPYLNVLRRVQSNEVSAKRIALSTEDIMNHDYSTYRIVYSYMPIKDGKQCKKFYRKVLKELNPGSCLIDYYGPLREVAMNLKSVEWLDGVATKL